MRQSLEMSFKRQDILKALKDNRDRHITIVAEAQKGYREEITVMLEKALKDVKAGEQFSPYELFRGINVPVNHVDEYDCAIEMLEICPDDTITMSSAQFQNFIRDKWDWTGDFLLSNSKYSKTASDMVLPKV